MVPVNDSVIYFANKISSDVKERNVDGIIAKVYR